MDVIAAISTKGGAGKTTLCAHLGVEAAKHGRVALIDIDPQASLSRWWNARQAETPSFVTTTLKDIPKQLSALRQTGYSLAIIDTPGAEVSHTRQVLRLVDLAIIPSRPSPLDLGTLGATVAMVEAEGKPLLFVLNGVTARTRISAQAAMELSKHGPIGAMLHQRTDFASSMTDGRVAAELDPSSRSGAEIVGLWKEVSQHLRKHSRKEAAA